MNVNSFIKIFLTLKRECGTVRHMKNFHIKPEFNYI
jgi:hypothetical protein